ncbi:MAG: ATP-binding protein [Deltaproteobacteria bacterium]|nr:ATP-binding protein [Deltaproteobacteria bacterium]
MIFLIGPRQVGKTTLAKSMIPDLKPGFNYFNWDLTSDRKFLATQLFPGKINLKEPGRGVLVFDEIHKYPRWKNTLKGLFDSNEPDTHWIITGSAALNVYRKGQDSLLGRSFLYLLCPFSVAEITGSPVIQSDPTAHLLNLKMSKPDNETQEAFDSLMRFGGFPEPFLKATESFLARWRTSRLERLINQDLGMTEHLKHLPILEQLMFLLPERVGSPLSLNSLREDLEIHHATAKHWIELLERVFYGFAVRPYTGKLSRALKKEPKWYLWDWSEIADKGKRFENMMAVHLMKFVQYINNMGLGNLSLHYVKDKEKREADFLIVNEKKPVLLIECKSKIKTVSESLRYFAHHLRVPRVMQLSMDSQESWLTEDKSIKREVASAATFLKQLI